jgi:hypothetical protein
MVIIKDETGKYNHKGMWILLSRDRKRVLYIFGPKKPSKKEINKQEKRVQFFKTKKYTVVKRHKRRIK